MWLFMVLHGDSDRIYREITLFDIQDGYYWAVLSMPADVFPSCWWPCAALVLDSSVLCSKLKEDHRLQWIDLHTATFFNTSVSHHCFEKHPLTNQKICYAYFIWKSIHICLKRTMRVSPGNPSWKSRWFQRGQRMGAARGSGEGWGGGVCYEGGGEVHRAEHPFFWNKRTVNTLFHCCLFAGFVEA